MHHSAEFEIGSLWESRLVKGHFVEIVNVTKTYVIFQPRFLFGEKPSKVRERLTHPAFSKFYVAVKPKSLVDGVAPIERPVSAGSTWENRESSNKVGVMGVYGNRVYVIGVDSDGKWGGIQTDHTLLTFLQLYREVSTTEKESQMPATNKGSIWKGKVSNITVIIDDVKDGKVLLRPFGYVEKTAYPLSPMWISVENFFRSYDLECDTPTHNQTTTHTFPHTFPRIEPRFGPNSYKVQNLEFDHTHDFANDSFNVHATIEREIHRKLTEEDIFDARQFLRSQGHLIVSGDLMTEDIDQCPSRMPHTEHIWHAVYGDQVVQTTWTYKCNGREGE